MKMLDMLSGNYVVTLFLFAIVMKLVLLPMGIKQQKNQIKQAALRPKEMAIRKKYAGRTDKATQQKMQQDIMDLYQRENFNPMGGCLPMLLQMAIVLILYNIIRNPLTYICGLSADTVAEVVEAIKAVVPDYKGVDELAHISAISANGLQNIPALQGVTLPNFNFFGLDLSATPQFTSFNWLLIVPVLVFISQYGTMKLSRKFTYQPEQQGDAAKSMALMDITMPLMSVWFAFMLPAILGVYWVMQSVLSLVQTIIQAKLMPLPRFTEEDYKKAEKELKGKSVKTVSSSGDGSGKKVRSLHHIDDDDDVPATPPVKQEPKKESPIEAAPLKEDDREEK